MGKWVHRLSEVDKEARRAVCASCGPVVIRRIDAADRWRCDVAFRAARARYRKSTRKHHTTLVLEGLCDLCQLRPATAIDHDHECCPGKHSCGKCVRGKLCHDCNVGLGWLHDDVRTLARAIEYLQTHERPSRRLGERGVA